MQPLDPHGLCFLQGTWGAEKPINPQRRREEQGEATRCVDTDRFFTAMRLALP